MRLTPPSPTIGEEDGFKGTDLFGLAEFGERLTDLVCRLEEPLVIALDGPWGTGKSTFVRQWAGLLRQRDVPVILFDAFANDHQEDAFIPLAGEITALAQAGVERDPDPAGMLLDRAKKVGRVVAPFAVRAAIRAATFGALNIEEFENLGSEARDIIKATAVDASALTEGIIEERLQQARADREALEAFKTTLSEVANQLGSAAHETDDHSRPLVFIVDELDRCRPSFALNVLERIKHLFSVEGVHFVLVNHTPQLEAVIASSYGAVDARVYLEKFFSLRVTLPNRYQRNDVTANNIDAVRTQYIKYLWNVLELSTGDDDYDNNIKALMIALSKFNQLSLRTIERVTSYLALALATTNEKMFREPCLIVALCIMKQIDERAFVKAQSNTLRWQDTMVLMHMEQLGETGDFARKYWRFVLGKPGDREFDIALEKHLRLKFGIRNKTTILPTLCGYIDDLHLPPEPASES